MTDHNARPDQHGGPTVAPPPPFVDRRRASRRAEDRRSDDERRLLARALDILAAERAPETRLAGLLDLIAETAGAERAAVVADGGARHVAVAAAGPDDHGAASALAGWLDASAPRSRARRAASAAAHVTIVERDPDAAPRRTRRPNADPVYACLPIPSTGDVTLGFAFARATSAEALATRLPPALSRHVAVALSLVTHALATERELAALRSAEVERSRFVSTVAHELRTPLTGLSGYLDLILDGRVDDEDIRREFLERGRSIVASMAALVGDLLELSKLESGTLALECAPFSIADALTAVSSGLLPIALDRGVRLEVDAPSRMRTASGDRRRVEQILTNLAANALKFGAADRGVTLHGRVAGAVAAFVVRDEGPGIAPDDASRIFERFYRMTGHERVTGTGLGLPIARDLARAMDGDLDVASVEGTGSSFVLVLPGPAGTVDRASIATAMHELLAEETDRLETMAAVHEAVGQRVAPASGRARSAAGAERQPATARR